MKGAVKQTFFGTVLISMLAAFVALVQQNTVLAITHQNCKNFIVVFARGSGGSYASREFTSLRENLTERINQQAASYVIVDLDQSILANNDLNYEAVPVDGNWTAFENAAGSLLHSSFVGHYWQSEKSGVELLFKYLEQSPDIQNCPNTKLVLTGYSQGAQVIGDALWDKRMEPFKDRIVFNALFGDPKFMSHFGNTDPWLRGTLWPGNGGMLRARDPYLPDDMVQKTGSWCDDGDHICNGDATKVETTTHGNYPDIYIPQAANEIAARLQGYYAPHGQYVSPACGAAKQDIVLAVDISDAMRHASGFFFDPNIPIDLFSSACNMRIAVVGFDAPGKSAPQKLYDFTDNAIILGIELNSLGRIYSPVAHYEQEDTQARQGVSLAMDMPWQKDAQKAVLVVSFGRATRDITGNPVGNSPNEVLIHDPLSQDILRKSRAHGGVEIYEAFTVADSWMRNFNQVGGDYDYFVPFNMATGGDLLVDNCWAYCSTSHIQWSMNGLLGLKPVVAVPGVRAKVGDAVHLKTLDVAQGSNINHNYSADWYLNCSDLSDRWAGGTETIYSFQHAGTCLGAVVTTTNVRYCYFCGGTFDRTTSQQSVTVFPIDIKPANYQAPPLPGPIAKIEKKRTPTNLTFNWQYQASEPVGSTVFVIRDMHGSILAITSASSFTIDQLPIDAPEPNITIQAANSEGESEMTASKDFPTTSTDTARSASPTTTLAVPAEPTRTVDSVGQSTAPTLGTVSDILNDQINNNPKTTASNTMSAARQRTSNPNLWSIFLIAAIVVLGMFLTWWVVIVRSKLQRS